MMQHQEWQELIPFYISQTLNPEQNRAFESHLADCEGCKEEIEDWRMIASAVWREADEAARNLPPLSQEVYNRLAYRDKPPANRYAANPPRPQQTTAPLPPNVTVLPQKRGLRLPITMVAGLVVALIFGGLLLMFALRQPNPTEVALNSSGTPNGTGESGIAAQPETSETLTPTDIGIIPTEGPSLTPSITSTSGESQFYTNTPSVTRTNIPRTNPPTITPDTSNNTNLVPATTEAPTLTSTNEPFAPLGGGPYLTITPGLFAEGIAYCEVFNPTTVGIEIYEQANFNSQITGILAPEQNLRVLVMSIEGWYFVVTNNQASGWIPPAFAYLRGSCYATDIPIATATVSIATPIYEQATGRIVVVDAAYADLQSEPNFSSTIMGVVSRNEQFPVLGYQGTGSNRFVNIILADGSTAWLWAEIVIDYDASAVPATTTPQP